MGSYGNYHAWGNIISATGTLASINPFRYRGYYYDEDVGLYYLQSRYYDPATGRFINADAIEYLGINETPASYNLYAYCENDCVNSVDESGYGSVKAIGFGIQIELSIKIITVGIEFVWYTVSSIRGNRSKTNPYVYLYRGFGLSSDIKSIVSKITKNPSLLLNPQKISKFSGSICFFAIFSYGKFKKPEDYEGHFDGVSLTVWHVKGFTSFGDTCFTVGVGYSTALFSASSGRTNYVLTSSIIKGVNKLFGSASKETKTIKP